MKPSQENINRLKRNADLQSLYDNSYLVNPDNANYTYIKGKFFNNESTATASLLNVGTGLFSTIADVPADYVSNPISDDVVKIIKSSADYKVYNYGVVGLIVDQDETGKAVARTTYLPAEGWFPQDGVDNIARIYRDTNGVVTKYYMLVQTFRVGVTENVLYEMTSISISDSLTEVPLTTIEQTSQLLPSMKHPFK